MGYGVTPHRSSIVKEEIMFVFCLSYILPLFLLIGGAVFLRGGLRTAAILLSILWEVVAIISSLRPVGGGYVGVIKTPRGLRRVGPGVHFVPKGIGSLKKLLGGQNAYSVYVPIDGKMAFLDSGGTLKGVTAYITVIDPVLAVACENWMYSLRPLVGDAIVDWLQGGPYRDQIRARVGQDLEFFSREAAKIAAGWGLTVRISLNVQS